MIRPLMSLCLLLTSTVAHAQTQPAAPRLFQLDRQHLLDTKRRVQSGDATLKPALDRLREDATNALKEGPFSVTAKDATPPSGDKHDYLSLAPYWWPDPSKPDGLPYIRHDGKRNPEIYKIPDNMMMKRMSETVHTLALAYYFTNDETYAQRAALLLRTWFIEPGTRMNPHLKFAQGIPGINNGRGIGIIESLALISVVDAVGLLESSTLWSNGDDASLKQWFADYLTWLVESDNGKEESAEKNNHGTYYDIQVVSYARFLGKDEIARRVLGEVAIKRIAIQIEPDGRQPLELARTKAWSYSIMNARGLMQLAYLGKPLGIDLWSYKTADNRCIPAALDYLVPFALNQKPWPHEQLNGFRPEGALILLRRAAREYPNSPYSRLNVPPLPPAHIDNLIGPRLIGNDEDRK
jgi:hypothetical protein